MEVGKIYSCIVNFLGDITAEASDTKFNPSTGTELNGGKNEMGMEGVEIELSNDIEHKKPAIERPVYKNTAKEKVSKFENVRYGNEVYYNTKTERFDKKGKFLGDTLISEWTSKDNKEKYTETTDSNKDGFPVYRIKETKDASTGKIRSRVEQSDFYMSKRSGITPAKQVTTAYDSEGNLYTETTVIDPQKGTGTKTVVTQNPDGTTTTRVYSKQGKDINFLEISQLDRVTIHDSQGNLISQKDYPLT